MPPRKYNDSNNWWYRTRAHRDRHAQAMRNQQPNDNTPENLPLSAPQRRGPGEDVPNSRQDGLSQRRIDFDAIVETTVSNFATLAGQSAGQVAGNVVVSLGNAISPITGQLADAVAPMIAEYTQVTISDYVSDSINSYISSGSDAPPPSPPDYVSNDIELTQVTPNLRSGPIIDPDLSTMPTNRYPNRPNPGPVGPIKETSSNISSIIPSRVHCITYGFTL